MLKSEGFATSLYDPDSAFTLRDYCEENHLPYADVGLPVSRETFVAYGLEFQKRFVPTLEEKIIESVSLEDARFILQTSDDEWVYARRLIVAVGITHFGYLPPVLSGLPRKYVTHSSDHHDLSKFEGQEVAVIGSGASALDIAALLHESGAQVELIARREQIAFLEPPEVSRTLYQRITMPRSGLGLGWRSRLCTDAPLLFHAMPKRLRFRAVERHLGPAPTWFIREQVEGKFPMHLGSRIKDARIEESKVHLEIFKQDGSTARIVADHVIGATGFRVSMERLQFIDQALRRQVLTVDDTPVLSKHFESSVPGLFIVGVASANCFGPLTRFAYGAKFTAKRITRHLSVTA